MIKSITHKPIRMDRKTKTERSLFFLTALIPVKKAVISTSNATGTVKSHQRASKLRILSTSTRIIEVVINNKKNIFNPTDHLPSLVFGTKEILMVLFYQILNKSYGLGLVRGWAHYLEILGF